MLGLTFEALALSAMCSRIICARFLTSGASLTRADLLNFGSHDTIQAGSAGEIKLLHLISALVSFME